MTVSNVLTSTQRPTHSLGRFGLSRRLRLAFVIMDLLWRQFLMIYRVQVQEHDGTKPARQPNRRELDRVLVAPFRKLSWTVRFLWRMTLWNRELVSVCMSALNKAELRGCDQVVLYGNGDAIRILCAMARYRPVRIRAVCLSGPLRIAWPSRHLPEQWPEERVAQWPGTIVVATFANSGKRIARLSEIGISRERLIVLLSGE